jgi:replicative DNA helicase
MQEVERLLDDHQIERAVLGCVILDGEALTECLASGLSVIHFSNPVNKRVYAAMVDLHKSGLGIDVLSLKANLRSSGNFEYVGETVLHTLEIDLPDPGNIQAYIDAVKEDALRASVHKAGLRMSQAAGDPNRSTADMLHVMSSAMRQAASMADTGKGAVRIGESMDTLVEKLEEGMGTGIQTGYTGLDTMLIGLMDGGLYIIGGRPGMGKTALALNISKHAAANQDKSVVVVSLEMTQEELSMRYLSDETSIPSTKIRLGMLDDEDWKKIAQARTRMANLPIRVEDSGVETIETMGTKLRKISLASKLDMVIVDYLQLMDGTGRGNRADDVSEISRGLKLLAKELEVPILAMSQLNRKSEDRPDKRPQLADIRESGSIEQDADAVMFVYRPEWYRQMQNPGQPPSAEETAELILAKNRSGPTGSARLIWDATRMRFLNPKLNLQPPSGRTQPPSDETLRPSAPSSPGETEKHRQKSESVPYLPAAALEDDDAVPF